MKKLYFLNVVLVLFLAAACKKSDLPVSKDGSLHLDKNITMGVPTSPLTWEAADYMPTAPGQPQILVPWASGVSRQFTADIANDFKKIDGWELVYNTFSATAIPDRYYFILYNKYRGILRMYYYLPNTTNLIASSNIVHKLAIQGSAAASSPLMNFAGSEIIEWGTNVNFASTLEQWQIAPATWYAFEYEIAYDKNLAAQNIYSLNFVWPITSNSITNVVINGTSQGTLTGNINLPGTDLTISPSFTSNGGGNIIIKGASDVEKIKPSITTSLFNTLKGLVTKSLTSIAGGFVNKIFSGIFGGKSSDPADNVNLKINSTIALTGSLTNSILLGSPSISIPGYDQTATSGPVPAYNQPLGVLYPANKPTIIETEHIIPQTGSGGQQLPAKRQYIYSVDLSKLNFDYNPAVTNIARIERYQESVILNYSSSYSMIGERETIGNHDYLTGATVGTDGQKGSVVGIRVFFRITPNDGSPKSIIVKTLAANLVKVTVNDPPGEEQF